MCPSDLGWGAQIRCGITTAGTRFISSMISDTATRRTLWVAHGADAGVFIWVGRRNRSVYVCHHTLKMVVLFWEYQVKPLWFDTVHFLHFQTLTHTHTHLDGHQIRSLLLSTIPFPQESRSRPPSTSKHPSMTPIKSSIYPILICSHFEAPLALDEGLSLTPSLSLHFFTLSLIDMWNKSLSCSLKAVGVEGLKGAHCQCESTLSGNNSVPKALRTC